MFLSAAKFQTFLLETSIIIPTQLKPHSFHIFYYFWEGCDATLREKLHLNKIDKPFIYNFSKRIDDKYEMKWKRFIAALTQLEFNNSQINGITQILGAIFHLNYASATQGIASKSTFIRAENAEIAAKLLGITFDQLSQAIFNGFISSKTNPTNFASSNSISIRQ